MRCTDVLKRLQEERDWDINKSLLLFYDNKGIVKPRRDQFFRRNYTETDYARLKWAITLSKSHVTIPIIKRILDLDRDIMKLTAQALREKSQTDWLTAEELEDRANARNKV